MRLSVKDLHQPVLILYNRPRGSEGTGHAGEFSESDEGVLAQVAAVAEVLERLKIPYRSVGLTGLAELREVLAAAAEKLVFNLAEGFINNASEANYVPRIIEASGRGCTGNGSSALLLSLDKWLSKAVLERCGVRVPRGATVEVGQAVPIDLFSGPYIVKPCHSDASEGIDAHSVVDGAREKLDKLVADIHQRFGQAALVEQYIDGREFNVSVIEHGREIRVLPVAEIDFSNFGAERPRIVGYAAKWLPDSFEFNNTPRKFGSKLPELVGKDFEVMALESWKAMGCRDYARVDFRLDVNGRAYVLEVNANPDISKDAGFAAALEAGGIAYEEFVTMMLDNARQRANIDIGDGCNGTETGIRRSVPGDRAAVAGLLEATRFFRADEMEIALEVLDEALVKGESGHYQSYVIEHGGEAAGWVCFGPTPCTIGTYDIYWLAVNPVSQGLGLGAALMNFAEEQIRRLGGRLAIVETNGCARYEPTRRFYLRVGYHESARVENFYSEGDDKVIYAKKLSL